MKTYFAFLLLMAAVAIVCNGAPVNSSDEVVNPVESTLETSPQSAPKPLKKSHKSKLVKIPNEIGKKKPVSPKETKKVKIVDSPTWNVPPVEAGLNDVPLRGHSILADGLFGDPESHRLLYPFDRF